MSDELTSGEVAGQDGIGVPDGFARLWMPHRMAYIKGEGKVPAGREDEECPFCRAPTLSDEDGLIVARGQLVFTVLNLYPYNAGHLMVLPYRHVADYTELDPGETAELADHTKRAMIALRAASGAQGFNIGMNMGSVAGAGIAAHLHQHVVPRWGGDTNFMPVVGHTRVLPQLLTGHPQADRRRLASSVSQGGRPPGTPRSPLRAEAGTAGRDGSGRPPHPIAAPRRAGAACRLARFPLAGVGFGHLVGQVRRERFVTQVAAAERAGAV